MHVVSKRNKRDGVIMAEIIIADTWVKRLVGLMMKKDFDDILVIAMPFESRLNGIHTCFMRFPIDVYFLDSSGKLVDLVKSIPPWKTGVYPKKPAKYIVEVKAGKRVNISEVRRKLGREL